MEPFHQEWENGHKMEMCLRMVIGGTSPAAAKNNANQSKGQRIWGRLRDPA